MHQNNYLHLDLTPAKHFNEWFRTNSSGFRLRSRIDDPNVPVFVALDVTSVQYRRHELFDRVMLVLASDVWSLGMNLYNSRRIK